MSTFEITVKDETGATVISLGGYGNAEAGKQLITTVVELGRQGKVRVVVDLSPCKVLNSPGVTSLMDITMKIIDDFKGQLVLCGLDPLKISVLKMARVIPMVPVAKTLPEALELLRSS